MKLIKLYDEELYNMLVFFQEFYDGDCYLLKRVVTVFHLRIEENERFREAYTERFGTPNGAQSGTDRG